MSELSRADLVGQEDAPPVDQALLDLARDLQAFRRLRFDYLPGHVLGEPAWDVLLASYIATSEQRVLTLSQLWRDSGISNGAASRHIDALVREGLLERTPDQATRNRVLVSLTEAGQGAMVALLASWPALRR